MKTTFSFQQFKALFFVQSVFALMTAAPDVADAVDIKDTDYPVPTGAYFVSPDGKDTNSGKTADEPWSVAKALDTAPDGATIVFRGGTYRNVDANLNKKLTLQAYPHEKPWLKGSVVVSGWVKDGGIWRKDGWDYSFPQEVGDEYIDPDYPMAGRGDMVYINGVSLKQVGSKASVVAGTFYVDAANKQLYIGDNPEGKTLEATALDTAFSLWKNSSDGPSDTTIRGLGFAHYAETAIALGAPSVTLENNTFVWNGIQGVWIAGQSGGTLGVSADATVRGNTFSYNGRKGIGGSRADRMLLEGNTISYNNVSHFRKAWDAAGVKLTETDGLIWRNNIVENNFATGMWLDISSTNATVVNNTVRNNESIGIQFELSHNAIIAGNVVNNNGAGIMLGDSSNARVYNNTLSMNSKNLVVADSTRENTEAADVADGVRWVTRDNVVKNNILSDTNTTAVLFDASNCNTDQESKLMINAVDNNAYYRSSSLNQPNLFKWSLGAARCSVKYDSEADFKAATGFEQNGLFVEDVATNPFFVDETRGDYRLKPGSPASFSGEPLPEDIASAIGVTALVPVDLGAIQSKAVLVNN